MTSRECLARVLAEHFRPIASPSYEDFTISDLRAFWFNGGGSNLLDVVDALLLALREPSEGQKAAANRLNHPRDEEIYQAMIDVLREGGHE